MLPYAFFLGGQDLEMVAIRGLIDRHLAPDRIHDKNLPWGARVESYTGELQSVLAKGQTPVLVELGGADEWSRAAQGDCVIIDHHDDRAGAERPSSLRQVFALLELPERDWSRWFSLVDANDKGHVRAMQELGATTEEMREVRSRDRAAQGVTAEQETQARAALERARVVGDGRLTIVELPHDRTSPVADALEAALGGPGFHNLLILTPSGRHFFGQGDAVLRLKERFGGWSGGMLPERGFWGIAQPLSEDLLLSAIGKSAQP